MPIESEMKCKIFEIKLALNICKQSMGKKIKVMGSSCKENDARSWVKVIISNKGWLNNHNFVVVNVEGVK